jgi:hypothetical protein
MDDIIKVTITKETKAVQQAGFGVPLILGPNATFNGKTRTYTSLNSVADDFEPTDAEFLAAQAIFAQNIKVDKIKIGKQAAKVAQVTVLSFDIDFVALNQIDYDIDGVAQTPVVFDTDQATTIAALATAIQAHPKISTAQVTDTKEITITAQTAGIPFSISEVIVTLGATQPVATIETTTPNYGLVNDLIEIIHLDDDWYGLIITSRNATEVELVADYIETQKKVFFTCSDDVNILDANITTDIASVLNLKNYERTTVIYNATPDDFADAAWMGRGFPIDPGGLTFALKELVGITPDNLTDTEKEAALGKNCNVYIERGGVGITLEGKMASGEYIDVIRDIDWLMSRIQTEIFFQLVNQNKVPYTDAGVALIESVLRSVLRQAQNSNVLSSDPDVIITVPKVINISPIDKANRHLPNVSFEGTLASAIHSVTIIGNVSL